MSETDRFDHKNFLKTLSTRPGVYRMLADDREVLYVGKAKNLRKRVSSYFTRSLNRRIQLMVSQISAIEITITNSEAEALILENQLIKSLKPRYNVLLRDDKSYPYIYLSDDEFPRLAFHRGARKAKGRYFGPYPGSGAVRETLHLIQKVFPVRQCEESFYRNRSRPCLQYKIKRCTAPCVGLVTKEQYRQDVIEALIARAPERNRQHLRRLQWRIEQERKRAANPLSACVKLYRMMWESFAGECGLIDTLQNTRNSPHSPDSLRPKAKVVSLVTTENPTES